MPRRWKVLSALTLFVFVQLCEPTKAEWFTELLPCFYAAEQVAVEAATSNDSVQVEFHKEGSFWAFQPLDKPVIPVGFIFYTGALVDEVAYAPILRTLAEQGYPAFLLRLPLDLAVLAPLAATRVMDQNHDMETWVVGGHSLGGTMAAMVAKLFPEDITGLVLLSSFPTPIVCNLSKLDHLRAVSLWGNLDSLISRALWEGGRNQLPGDSRFIEIDGGNHAQMGYYGAQAGDTAATIPREEQQAIVVEELLGLMEAIAVDHDLIVVPDPATAPPI